MISLVSRAHRPTLLVALNAAVLLALLCLIAPEARGAGCELHPQPALKIEWPTTSAVGQTIPASYFAEPIETDANGDFGPLVAVDQLATSQNGAAVALAPNGGAVALALRGGFSLAAPTAPGTISLTTTWRESYRGPTASILTCPRSQTNLIEVIPASPPRYLSRIGYGGEPGFEVDYLSLRLAGACELSPTQPLTLSVAEPGRRRVIQISGPCSEQVRAARTNRWRITYGQDPGFRLELIRIPRPSGERNERRLLTVSLRQGGTTLYRQKLRARWQFIPSSYIPAGSSRYRNCLRSGGRVVVASGATYCRTQPISLTVLSRAR